jgi:hypothetical protein
MADETRREELNKLSDERNADRAKMVTLYKSIQAISGAIPNFNNPDIDVTANTILEGLKLMEQWIATTCQKHFNK